MICITSRGSDYSPGSPVNSLDYLEQYLRGIFGFAGITDFTFINAQPLDYTPELTEAKIAEAEKEAVQLGQTLKL